MSVVALPIRFGSRRFGKVQGGVLATDGLAYPQPACLQRIDENPEYWDGGTTFLVQSPWADRAIEQYGFKPNALISGGEQDTYGQPLKGWLFCDDANDSVWLIRPIFASASTTFASSLSIPFDIFRFGVFDGGGERPKTTATETLADWGQSTPNIADARSSSCSGLTITEGDLHLVSAKKDGSIAVVMVSLATGTEGIGYEEEGMPTLRRWPIGFIGVTCTAGPDGGPPTLALSVLRDRATTLGTRSPLTLNEGIEPASLCDYGGGTMDDVFQGSEQFDQSVTGEILALWYQDDVLTEMLVNCSIEGQSNLDPAVYVGQVGGKDQYTQHSEGTITITWELAIGATTVSWAYTVTEEMDATLTCGTSQAWTLDSTETLADGTDVIETYTVSTNGFQFETLPVMPHVLADSGAYSFTLHGACRSVGDIWLDGYWFEDAVWHSMTFIRYAYNVIGLLVRGGVNIRGPALAPGGKIARSAISTGYYGAYNARTGEAVAGETTTVSYV